MTPYAGPFFEQSGVAISAKGGSRAGTSGTLAHFFLYTITHSSVSAWATPVPMGSTPSRSSASERSGSAYSRRKRALQSSRTSRSRCLVESGPASLYHDIYLSALGSTKEGKARYWIILEQPQRALEPFQAVRLKGGLPESLQVGGG